MARRLVCMWSDGELSLDTKHQVMIMMLIAPSTTHPFCPSRKLCCSPPWLYLTLTTMCICRCFGPFYPTPHADLLSRACPLRSVRQIALIPLHAYDSYQLYVMLPLPSSATSLMHASAHGLIYHIATRLRGRRTDIPVSETGISEISGYQARAVTNLFLSFHTLLGIPQSYALPTVLFASLSQSRPYLIATPLLSQRTLLNLV